MIIEYTCPKCGGDLLEEVICTYPPIYKIYCPKCGWSNEQQEKIIQIPYEEIITTTYTIPESCKYCSNHPSNGGNGICHCILGTPEIIC